MLLKDKENEDLKQRVRVLYKYLPGRSLREGNSGQVGDDKADADDLRPDHRVAEGAIRDFPCRADRVDERPHAFRKSSRKGCKFCTV